MFSIDIIVNYGLYCLQWHFPKLQAKLKSRVRRFLLPRLFVCLYVCWNKIRKTILCLLLGKKQTPREWSHLGRGTNHVHSKDSGTNHVLVNVWLTLHKLTCWLASLDTTKTTSVASSATERPCMTYWFCTGGGVTVKQWTVWWIEIANYPPTQQIKTRPDSRTGFEGLVDTSWLYF